MIVIANNVPITLNNFFSLSVGTSGISVVTGFLKIKKKHYKFV